MLQVKQISKSYGKKQIVDHISFSVNKGEAFGLLGPNGAGKSTTISMICGLIDADQGAIEIDGLSINKHTNEIKRKIGIVPQDIALYPTMSARDNLIFWGKMYGLSSKSAKNRANQVLALVGLEERAKDKIETFSGGMKRRINIGAALMHEPELLIMDEPTVGIDPQSRNHILDTVKQLNQQGVTVIYTSHYMEEVEFLCNRIGIIDNGQMIAIGTKTDLCNRLSNGSFIHLTVADHNQKLIDEIEALDCVTKVINKENGTTLEIIVPDPKIALGRIVTQASALGINVVSVHVKEPNLESLFLQLTGRSLRD
ncbi:ABC transporter ATP-binding protein [Radiobacillus sp. PE A8.2]|uniref:ABC transporter ATP-binding protein n=1 Tax=Radiobacillus sp. PE A8.2 TaxID=3380349 RepID=UPI00388FE050